MDVIKTVVDELQVLKTVQAFNSVPGPHHDPDYDIQAVYDASQAGSPSQCGSSSGQSTGPGHVPDRSDIVMGTISYILACLVLFLIGLYFVDQMVPVVGALALSDSANVGEPAGLE